MSHHDGTNYTLYRIAKDEEDAERIAEMIYNNEIEMCIRDRSCPQCYSFTFVHTLLYDIVVNNLLQTNEMVLCRPCPLLNNFPVCNGIIFR